MGEIKSSEAKEVKTPEEQGVKDIKPENGTKPNEARDYWNEKMDNGLREASDEEKSRLIDGGMSSGTAEKIKVDNEGIYHIEKPGEVTSDLRDPKTGVPFERKIVDLGYAKVEGLFAKFDSVFKCTLPDDKLRSDNRVQFKYCVSQLQEAVKNNPELKKEFTQRQLEQINAGEHKISGYTWNHNEEKGVMELVKSEQHDPTPHVGGKALWGGGY